MLIKVSKALFLIVAITQIQVSFAQNTVNWWLTTNDKTALLTKQVPLAFGQGTSSADVPVITVTSRKSINR